MTYQELDKAIKYLEQEIRYLKAAPYINGCDMQPYWQEQIDVFSTALEALNDKLPKVEIYDKETIIENATVQILENSVTGDVSIGWTKGDG